MKTPKCPHCGFYFTDEHIFHNAQFCDFPTEDDGDDGEFYCPGCDCSLVAILEMEPSWSFIDEDGNEIRQRDSTTSDVLEPLKAE